MSIVKNKTKLESTGVEENLWSAFFMDHSVASREALVIFYQDFARKVAKRVYYSRIRGNQVDFEDCHQVSILALMESIDNFDPAYEVLFTTYATYRIKGALHSAIDKATEKNQIISYARSTNSEAYCSMIDQYPQGCSFDDLFSLTLDFATIEFLGAENQQQSEMESGHPSPYSSPYEFSISCELRKILESFLDPDKRVLYEHYFNHMMFNDIAKLLSVSPGRISQIHARAIKRLRAIYSHESQKNKA